MTTTVASHTMVQNRAEASKPTAVSEARPRARSGFIIGPVADSFLIIGAPLLALVIAVPLFMLPASVCSAPIAGRSVDLRQAFLISFIMAHLVLVFFRSHANTKIFWTHPLRFTVVPLALLVSMASSMWVFGIATVLV